LEIFNIIGLQIPKRKFFSDLAEDEKREDEARFLSTNC